uniref:Transporter n=1 Tax=Phallusia mammillata TaxID=59560 RepID=A0A6F9DTV3_9ASCI|nr:sodium- and chloride-dependent GABA transporter 1-like [Phallusia mammillata]
MSNPNVLEKMSSTRSSKTKRESWNKSWDFVLALLGGSIGLGNVWRFPYLCFKNGGGAFLFPYLFFVMVLAIPMVMLETSMGQRVRRGLVQSWEIVPVFKGLAVAQIMVSFYFNVCYAVIMAWCFKYFQVSFMSPLPWSTCGNPWNTNRCVTAKKNIESSINITTFENSSHTDATSHAINSSHNATTTIGVTSSATEYWFRGILDVSPAIEVSGSFRWDLVICLIAVWILAYLATFKGIKWTAKIVYVTATLPFLLIIVILIRGLTLQGASLGLRYYVIPDMTKIANPEVWVAAATQVIYSYSVGSGILTTLGSYNKCHHNFWRDAATFSIFNTLTSFVSGLAIFSTLGFMANYQNTTVEKVASSGPGLAFIAYPEALSLLPLPQLWSVVFFLMIIFIGFDSMFISQEAIMAILFDNIPVLRKRKELYHAIVCFLMGCIGLTMVTQGGVYVFEIFNNYGTSGWCMFLITATECVAIDWVFGFERYWVEIKNMIGKRRGKYWLLVSWKFVAPTICIIIAGYYVTMHKPLRYRDYVYPPWAQAIAHLMSFSSVIMIPAYAIYSTYTTWKNGGSFRKLLGQQPNEIVKEAEPLATSTAI